MKQTRQTGYAEDSDPRVQGHQKRVSEGNKTRQEPRNARQIDIGGMRTNRQGLIGRMDTPCKLFIFSSSPGRKWNCHIGQ